MIEIWKDIDFIDGFGGLYKISNYGQVKTIGRIVKYPNSCFNKTDKGVFRPEKLLKPSSKRYAGVTLSNQKIKIYLNIHRLVAMAFIPNPNNLPQVNHKDGNKLNNIVNNLEWVTPSQNVKHSYDNGLQKVVYGKDNPSYKHGKYAKKGITK
jgi:hypothetical protein